MICIDNARVVLESGILDSGRILIHQGYILAVGSREEVPIPEQAQVVDARGSYVGPGFVDIHTHGGNGAMFHQAPQKAAQHFLRHGETTVLAALYYDLTKEEFLEAIHRIQMAMGTKAGASIAGIYMEGPYMNPKYGASAEKNRWRGPVDPQDYRAIVNRAGMLARVWAVAPEREGVAEFVAYVRRVNPLATIAVGHSEATPQQVQSLKPLGLSLQTHCMNATGRVNEWAGVRGCGPDEACLLDPDMYAELISDSMGVHVAPALQQLILKVKGVEKVVLISDSFVGQGKAPERLANATDLMFDEGGNLCGSRLTLDVACRNVMRHTGCTMADAFRMAAGNPARAVGLFDEIGSIAPGKRADLVFVDEQFRVQTVMLLGKIQEFKKEEGKLC